jgi:ubiquinone/menaquinone biosynthesis C-methylase UbiE
MHEKRFHRDISWLRDPDRVAQLELERVVELIFEGLDANAARSALDIGTGSGLFAEQFVRRGLSAAGVDANPEMVAAAQAQVPQAEFKLAIAEELPFADSSFDVVFMGLVLHETDDPLKALQEARRVGCSRVALLEWPYREGPVGPGLAERLPADLVLAFAQQAGLALRDPLDLQNVVVYRFDIPPKPVG